MFAAQPYSTLSLTLTRPYILNNKKEKKRSRLHFYTSALFSLSATQDVLPLLMCKYLEQTEILNLGIEIGLVTLGHRVESYNITKIQNDSVLFSWCECFLLLTLFHCGRETRDRLKGFLGSFRSTDRTKSAGEGENIDRDIMNMPDQMDNHRFRHFSSPA